MPDGTTAYTRNGEFQLNSDGEIVTSSGLQHGADYFGAAGRAERHDQPRRHRRGAIRGQSAPQQIGQIQLADFINPTGLQAIGNNLFLETASSGSPAAGSTGQRLALAAVEQGTLEASNVDVVEEMVNMIATQRTYEMNSKVIATADQMLQFITQTL